MRRALPSQTHRGSLRSLGSLLNSDRSAAHFWKGAVREQADLAGSFRRHLDGWGGFRK
jgi:hypothetical protein